MGRVTTKTGDEGYTDLLGATRVPKYHRRPEAYGTVDEASAALGLARAHASEYDREVAGWLLRMQRQLYVLMAELATPPENYAKVDFKIALTDVDEVEQLGEQLKGRVEIGKEFVVPGGTVLGATLDLARTIVRRAERQVARLYHDGDVTNLEALRYLNRLSDVLFILARFAERDAES